MKTQNGISLVALIITIIVIIILAAIIIPDTMNTPNKAYYTKFCGDMETVEGAIQTAYSDLSVDYALEGSMLSDTELYAEIGTGNSSTLPVTGVFPDGNHSIIIINDSHKIKDVSGLPEYKDESGNNQVLAIDIADGSVYMIPGLLFEGKYYYSATSQGSNVAAHVQ
jgi:type II secretory pathway pseudopilin PulG